MINNYIKYILIGLSISLFTSCKQSSNSWVLLSPNKGIKVEIHRDETQNTDKLLYSVYKKDKSGYTQIIESSPLGIEREDDLFIDNLTFLSSKTIKNQKVEYSLISGSKKKYYNTFNENTLAFYNLNNKRIDLIFRAYNNGIALQYYFPENGIKQVRILKELTGFNLREGELWAHTYDTVTKWTPGYETCYNGPIKIGTNAPKNKNGWAFPLLFRTSNNWVFISESGFDGSYGGSHIDNNCEDGVYKIKFAESEEAMGYFENTQHSELPWRTPWRYITIGKTLAEITESHMVTDLAFPSKIDNTEWIKPGRASWSWWSDSESPQDYNRIIPFINLASEMSWEYSLVDANWNHMANGNIQQLATYAANKNVGLLIWYNSGGIHNGISEEPRDLMYKREARRSEFERINKLGIKGIKVDFFQSDKQHIIQQYIEILEDAADFNLLVNFHGCTLPKGWRRTYPNLLSMEAIKGAENYKFDKNYPEHAPSHIATIPFIRGVAGPTDYTPVGFSNRKYPHLTTYGFELALSIVIESGIIHYTDTQKKIRSLPNTIIEFLKELPSTWDNTKLICGFPGKEAVIARKKNNKWFVGGINGESTKKTISIDISGIASIGDEITIIYDDNSSSKLDSKTYLLESTELNMQMRAFGGFVCIVKSNMNIVN